MLSNETIEQEMKKLALEWSLTSAAQIERVVETADFDSALEVVNQIAELANQQNHHPDIQLSWGKVVITLTTHSEGGLTQKDFDLAQAIEERIAA